jgi:spore coat protein A
MDMTADVPVEAELGTAGDGPLSWDHPISEEPVAGDTEVWQILNLTGDAHPIHLHLVMFQVVERIPFDAEGYSEAQHLYLEEGDEAPVVEDFLTGAPVAPEAWEAGWKDTVIANPGEVTRVIATFDLEGLYVWHCHILEHEDNEMMRPYRVVSP